MFQRLNHCSTGTCPRWTWSPSRMCKHKSHTRMPTASHLPGHRGLSTLLSDSRPLLSQSMRAQADTHSEVGTCMLCAHVPPPPAHTEMEMTITRFCGNWPDSLLTSHRLLSTLRGSSSPRRRGFTSVIPQCTQCSAWHLRPAQPMRFHALGLVSGLWQFRALTLQSDRCPPPCEARESTFLSLSPLEPAPARVPPGECSSTQGTEVLLLLGLCLHGSTWFPLGPFRSLPQCHLSSEDLPDLFPSTATPLPLPSLLCYSQLSPLCIIHSILVS